ncbi:zinc finger RNA-binding protein-like isoform X2 [Pistacia vera]|uniref:zinc finger RNA-binding protein-like isoform X2 n=2 Tax=Pistacia vera TaxID=55513 RepID=UPI001263A1D0|nr:zinc finger RNA-binding protein-like isoform X2 [Pistacia vera]
MLILVKLLSLNGKNKRGSTLKKRSVSGEITVLEMGDESRKYVMDLELAIQRELAYRRKIFLSQLQTDKDFKTDPVPLERIAHVPSSSSTVSPSRTPTSKSLSSSSPWLSGMKRDAAPSGSESLQPQQPQSSNSKPMHTNQSDVIFCTICNVPCHGTRNYKQHLDGQKHKAKLQNMKLHRNDVGQCSKEANQQRWGKVCNTGCTSAELFKQHLCGKKHKVELGKLECARKDSGDLPKQPKYCKLCDLWCPNEDAYKMHLEGKRHII